LDEAVEGRRILQGVFLHGNPTSSYLWRDVGRTSLDVAGASHQIPSGWGTLDKLPDSRPHSYTFVEHRRYLDALLDRLGVREKVTLVGHDWGSALAFDWARRHPEAVAGIVYMEAIVRPMAFEEWSARKIFERMRSLEGEEMVLGGNAFVEKILPRSIQRTLTDEEMAEYRRPFLDAGEARRPTLAWPRQMPLDGEPQDVVQIVQAYADWLSASPVPKLFINSEPGAILVGGMREFCRTWPNQAEVTIRGIHFVQEDSAADIGAAIRDWMTR
jgi:haloalkane dehalogenase